MNYILFVSNKESVNPYYIAAWKNVAASNELNESNIKFKLFSGTEKTYIDSNDINKDCKGILINWMGQNDDKRVLHMLRIAQEKGIPLVANFTYGNNKIINLLNNEIANQVASYMNNGGMYNIKNLYLYLLNNLLNINVIYKNPKELTWSGIYIPEADNVLTKEAFYEKYYNPSLPTVAINFPREHWAWGHTSYIDSLINELRQLDCNVLPIFSHWNRDRERNIPGFENNILELGYFKGAFIPQVLINCLWFSLTVGRDVEDKNLLKKLNIPILQGEILLQDVESWEASSYGLNENELQANIIMPEFDGVVHGVPLAGQKKDGTLVTMVPIYDNIKLMAKRAYCWAQLKLKQNKDKRIALIFHNYPAGNAIIGTAMGLDSLRSGEVILENLQKAGYRTDELPKESGWLAEKLLSSFTNEVEFFKSNLEPCGKYPVGSYKQWYENLGVDTRNHIKNNWGEMPGNSFLTDTEEEFKIAGFKQGNIFVGVQPPRIAFGDIQKSFHNGDIPPTHYYLAFYRWLVEEFKADAVIHLGTHGSLEWLPGKSTGLCRASYPYLAIDSLPNIYPYLMSITCEGLQAKRRGAAVLVDHLPAPCEEAGLYGEMRELYDLVEQYLEAYRLQSSTVSQLEQVISELLLKEDMKCFCNKENEIDFCEQMENLHAYLEKISSNQCRTGLHILGDLGSEVDLRNLINSFTQGNNELKEIVLDKLSHTDEEITNILKGLDGCYIESGLSGAPSTGMLDCLPSGKNFYGVDPRLLPSKSAWIIGQQLANQVIQQYIEEEGRYPERIAMIFWSGTNMRTKGCDIAQAMALLGVSPEWNTNGRISGFKVIPLDVLKRPRIDVIARISGMYRDSLYPTVEYLDECIKCIMKLDEDGDVNYPRKHIMEDSNELEMTNYDNLQCRIFGSAPGTYGAGVNLAIESRNWQSIDDLRDVYVSWGSYAYGKNIKGQFLPEVFSKQLSKVDLTLKNEDHYETTMLESDDYNAFHGGMIAAVRSLSGKAPKSFCGNLSKKDSVSVQSLSEEMKQLYLSQVLNPKFIQGMKKHGYKGAADLCNIVSHSFAWDATSNVIEDWMYNELTKMYVISKDINDWLKKVNPWALRKMCTVLLEAKQRGLWNAPKELESALMQEFLEIEGDLEELSDE